MDREGTEHDEPRQPPHFRLAIIQHFRQTFARTMRLIRILLLLILCGVSPAAATLRTWTDRWGQRIEAELVGRQNEMVLLRDAADREIAIPLDTLSPTDRRYLEAAHSAAPTEPAVEPEAINARMGLPLFGTTPLWSESAATTAARLRWPRESKTSAASSYRYYPMPYAHVLGARAVSMQLLAERDQPIEISLMFANKGDIDRLAGIPPDTSDTDAERIIERARADYGKIIRQDARALAETLTALFGESSGRRLGESSRTETRADRWDWNGHTFLLAAPQDEYVLLRIVPTASLDEAGAPRRSRSDLSVELSRRVQRRPNGDVIITDIPMVNQGPKGYCVPATWERVLRYMGIPADMYVLAMAGQTGVGGGTHLREMQEGASRLVQRHGRVIRSEDIKIGLTTIDRAIDEGIPLIWSMYSMPAFDAEITRRSKARQSVYDWTAWEEGLKDKRRRARDIQTSPDRGHVCLIIGYNKATGEVAISDSWGPTYEERWLTFEEAEAINQGRINRIEP
jgi:hypothetical protein